MVYMAYDGDNAGRLCGRAILADNPDALHEVSERIQLGHEIVRRWVESHSGQFISGGGDEGVFSIPAEAIPSVEELRADYKFATNLTATIGIGNTLSEAGKAMLVGKFRGKNTVVQYAPEIEQEIRQAQNHISQGTGSQEEKKIGEAYLQDEGTVSTMINNKAEGDNSSNDNIPNQSHDDCPYCADLKGTNTEDPNHCKYCHDMDTENDCPYCNEGTSPSITAGDADCPYCKPTDDGCPYCNDSGRAAAGGPSSSQDVQPTAGPTVQNPTTTDSENYAGQDLNTPDIPKPDPIQQNPDGLGTTMDVPTNENTKLTAQGQGSQTAIASPGAQDESPIPQVDPQSEETIEGIAQEIEAQPSDIQPEAQSVNHIDSSDTATGTRMEENVARPENYDDQNHPSDMGLGEEETSPDITGVMSEGLDSHAQNINREKVINLVSEALVGFKACRGILEKAKVQAPQLYESSIAMLKAMIEMAKMLGLDQEAQAPTGEDPLANDPAAATPNSPIQDSSSQNSAQGSVDPSTGRAQTDVRAGIPQYQQADNKAAAAKEDAAPSIPKKKGQSANQ
jgi:hypothetical protein